MHFLAPQSGERAGVRGKIKTHFTPNPVGGEGEDPVDFRWLYFPRANQSRFSPKKLLAAKGFGDLQFSMVAGIDNFSACFLGR
jgi:hypothetical protein